jgi:hypothetical protein
MVQHLDSDRLILRALDDEPLDDQETGHLDDCARCRTDLAELRHVVAEGRQTQGLQALPMPPPQVWDRIQQELALTGRATAPPPVTLHTDAAPPAAARLTDAMSPGAARPTDAASPSAARPTGAGTSAGAPPTGGVPDEPGNVVRLSAVRSRRRGPGWAATVVAVAAAAAITAAVTLVVARRPAPAPQAQPCAGTPQVRLEALPGVPAGVTGYACLRTTDGQRRLHIHATGMPDQPDGDYEAWLLDATSLTGPSLRMEALGELGGRADQELPVPANLDLSRYKVIDISAEPHDGNAAHSGHSLLRGTLG